MDLLARIDDWGRVAPSRPAHISSGQTLTYGELRRRSDRLAAALAARLPADHTPVAVLGHKEPEMLVAFLGAVKAGHPYIPLDTSTPQQRIDQVLTGAKPAMVLTPQVVAELTAAGAPAGAPAATAGSPAPAPVAPADPFYIIYTSGSTGQPKGVVITLGNLTDFLTWMLDEEGFGEGEVFLNQAPFSFDLSVMDLYLSLATGGTLVSLTAAEIADPKALFAVLRASQATTWVSTPSFAQLCLAERGFSEAMLPQMRRFLFCGETLPPGTAAQLLERFPAAAVWNTYGPTETTVATTSVRINRDLLDRYNPLPVGWVKQRTRVVLLGDDDRPVADGERGEIIIAGPNVSAGYLHRADLTEHAFRAWDGTRAYHTGDWGRFQDGLLFFEGRMDSQVKLHGYRIELGDVEANLRALPEVRDAVVVPALKAGRVESLVAFIVPADRGADSGAGPGADQDASDLERAQALREALGHRLPAYMLPRRFVFLDALPMTANGKADRRKLAEALS